jgi:hypothetical protein
LPIASYINYIQLPLHVIKMVTNYGDDIYREIKKGGLLSFFGQNRTDIENVATLDDLLASKVNITKCTMSDVEMGYHGSILYLEYLLQVRDDVDFGICELFKVWMNRAGWQYGCRLDKGKNRRIQTFCYGHLARCQRKEGYRIYLNTKRGDGI